MSLHDRIMRLQTDPHIETLPDGVRVAYKNGHNVARHDAAELSLEADEVMVEMAWALEQIKKGSYNCEHVEILACNALWAYNAWKEVKK